MMMNKNALLQLKIKILLKLTICLGLVSFALTLPFFAPQQSIAQNMESDGGYQIIDPSINSGGNDDQSSSSGYKLFTSISNNIQDERFDSDNYKLGSGSGYTFSANVPQIASVDSSDESICGEGGCYDRARFTIDTQSNPSDTLYCIELTTDNWNTVLIVDGDTHTPKPIANKDINDFLTKSSWEMGAWSDANLIELSAQTQYMIRARALNGDFTESAPGPSESFETNSPTIVFDLDTDGADGGTVNDCITGHTDNGDGTCTATYNSPTEDGHINDSWIRNSTSNTINWQNDTFEQIGYIEWDISELVSIREIETVSLNYHGYENNSVSADIKPIFTYQPSITGDNSTGNQNIFNEITTNQSYVSNWDPTASTNQTITLGNDATSDLYNQIITGQDWFAIGFDPASSGTSDSIYSQDYTTPTPPPTLEIIYTKSYPNTTWPYSVGLGDISTVGPSTASEFIWVYLGTNAINGATIAVRDANNGLLNSTSSQTIASQSEDLASVDDGYGLKVNTSHLYPTTGQPGHIKPTSTYNTSGSDEVGAVSTTPNTIFCTILENNQDCNTGTPGPITQGRGAIWIKAKASSSFSSGTYSDLLTFTVIGTF
jgi:hypothetical protein